ncbi:MAG: hypothetical protein PHV68_05725, partial [Candidatus Gastranaerophilales bacterium]|nr:hypothetical protein [Candidatus Gastranaerophilales bacterium]
AIIGIIASIVTPMLFGTTNNAENIAKWKKSYADISQAWRLASLDHGGTLSGIFTSTGYTLSNEFGNAVLEKMNYIKKCPAQATEADNNPCWHEVGESFTLNGAAINSNFSTNFTAILANGSYLRIGSITNQCPTTSCVFLGIDVNGSKKPNVQGKDIFYSGGYANGVYKVHSRTRDVSDPNDPYCCVESSTVVGGVSGQGCSKLALYCNEIDYTTGTCK